MFFKTRMAITLPKQLMQSIDCIYIFFICSPACVFALCFLCFTSRTANIFCIVVCVNA